MFDKFKKQGDSSVQVSQDRVGGFVPIPSDIYEAVIKQLWFGEYGSGAGYMDLQLEASGKTFRERILLSDRKGNNYWTKDDKSTFFDGFMALDAICLFVTGEDFEANMGNIENKMVKVYNADQKKEVPTEVPVMANVIGETIKVAILHCKVDVTKKDDNGNYNPTGEFREENTFVEGSGSRNQPYCDRDLERSVLPRSTQMHGLIAGKVKSAIKPKVLQPVVEQLVNLVLPVVVPPKAVVPGCSARSNADLLVP